MSPNKKKRLKVQKGAKFGKYRLVDKLGSGGNGDVWKVSNDEHDHYAMKILKNIDPISYQRFKAEVHVLSTIDIDGVLKVLESNLPEDPKSEFPWFILEIAEDFNVYQKDKDALEIVSGFVPLAKSLEELHKENISHRDIKPSNILFYNGRLFFTDFGLVKYPTREDITPKTRDVGAKFTMAPEMRRYADVADGKKADVYSFAKTIWIAITGEEKGFDGQYIANSVLGLKNYHKSLYLTKLDQLLAEATDNDENVRPTITEFISRLDEWLKLNKDFKKRNVTEWFEIQQILFPLGSPKHATWTDLDSIIGVLNEVAQVKALNHMFYPTGGGNTITAVSKAKEDGMLALHVGDIGAEILKPKKLTYESFGLEPSWNYFRLEVEETTAIGIPGVGSFKGTFQEMTEVEPGVYATYQCWDNNLYQGKPLPPLARPISRFMNGSFVFFCTTSPYNNLRGEYDAYNGQHNTLTEDQFREFIKQGAEYFATKKLA
ncbi:protein kinase domain-containing protein [Vibrio tubiashii]|uniref:Serine/threonine protein kinase n=1 Tax=Vibrio tubiashii ATCC 19109 TaxID=1051646 RepID=F9T004_9VIBR|nr:protein kinase [Vibrio tubiashii]AIW16271.1 serine/threonine protein kinase [Vibrio tubiashii ATCC 19109]EGU59082.1 serine/threonine protein kinase [Vibrio tubiashii ATCC 19109]EIF04760.1 serine/threonine protein kinase [Vibrio tubiashii NCIMB 1337 = ATCC 19106]